MRLARAALAVWLATALATAACSREPARTAAGPAAPAGPSGASGAPAPVAAALPAAEGRAWLVVPAPLRREPGEPTRRPAPAPVASLGRGEPVTLLDASGPWARVRTGRGLVGWVPRAALLEVEEASLATVLGPTDVFERPDLLAASPQQKLAAGALLLVLHQRPPFAEVNLGPGPSAWVLADRLATGAPDLAAARVCEQVRALQRAGKRSEARAALARGRQALPEAALLDRLAEEPGLAADGASAPVSPAAAPAPPPDPPAAAPRR